MLALPYVYPSLGFDYLWGVPANISLIVIDTAIIVLFLDLRREPRRADMARLAAIVGLGVYQLVLYPNFAPISAVILFFFGAVVLLATGSWRERAIKLTYVIVPAGVLLLVFGPFDSPQLVA